MQTQKSTKNEWSLWEWSRKQEANVSRFISSSVKEKLMKYELNVWKCTGCIANEWTKPTQYELVSFSSSSKQPIQMKTNEQTIHAQATKTNGEKKTESFTANDRNIVVGRRAKVTKTRSNNPFNTTRRSTRHIPLTHHTTNNNETTAERSGEVRGWREECEKRKREKLERIGL